jgi:hypothetical protein
MNFDNTDSVAGWLVPQDPMDQFQCDSCQKVKAPRTALNF